MIARRGASCQSRRRAPGCPPIACFGRLGGVPVSGETFVEIMASFPTGVAIVTTLDASGSPFGLTSNAVSSVSADPPQLLVCVAKTSRTFPTLVDRSGFVVNFMGEGSESVCALFASKVDPSEKFAAVPWRSTPGGLPHLHEHAIAFAECEVDQQIEAGTHVVFIARVLDGGVAAGDRGPIAYVRRSYRSWPSG
jgi:flavin reductase (DIM6/NTAB) family NADH-FMN oxidoreductase RutF